MGGPPSKLPTGLNYKHPFWVTWRHMRDRCQNPNIKDYKNYGGRGITLCKEWELFNNFYKDMFSSWSIGMTIERKNNELGYSLKNCIWIPRSEQSKNRRGVKRFKGKTLPEWSRELGINRSTLEMRYYKYNWDIDKVLNTPIKNTGRRIKI